MLDALQGIQPDGSGIAGYSFSGLNCSTVLWLA